jgi:hypothetical protein
MELNHQIRLCRPSPFLFGFRALSHDISNSDCYSQIIIIRQPFALASAQPRSL